MLSNIVMMGMGEPLYNFDNVRDALKIVMDGDGLGLSGAAITLSTSGVVPMMERAGERSESTSPCRFHAVTKEVRDEIVPLQPQIWDRGAAPGLRRLSGVNNARRITFEYVMLKDKNDSDEDARELVRLIRKYRLPARVNLIPFNPWPGSALLNARAPSGWRASQTLSSKPAFLRRSARPRGRDIMAACGQLNLPRRRRAVQSWTAGRREAGGARLG
jgi:23S rRNA (adenine2503-C2)-methyltransferase